MDYMYPHNFGNHEYASWSEMSYEEGINELYDFVEGNRVIGCIYDWWFYEVGGKIRDELLGLTNKDVDYVAVPTEAVYSKIHPCEAQLSPARLMFKALKNYLEEQKFEIFLVTPECYTIRAKFPEGYKYQGVADFVMARKEVGYVPGTRTPIVEPGNL